jgi:hypothetical protein
MRYHRNPQQRLPNPPTPDNLSADRALDAGGAP